jgi:hypothetical protein
MGGNVGLIRSLKSYSFIAVDEACAMPEDNLVCVLQREGVRETPGRNIHNAVKVVE